MKRLFSTASWKRRQKQRNRKLARRRASSRRRRSQIRRTRADRTPLRGEQRISAPSVLSFKINPSPTSRFVEELREAAATRKKVFIDLKSVTRVTTEAIAVLLACVKDHRDGVVLEGNLPEDPTARTFFCESGFFDHVDGPRIPQPKRGIICTRERFLVQPNSAESLAKHVANGLAEGVSRIQASYRVLIEAMANTREHAQGRGKTRARRKTNWWATSAFDKSKGEGYFACVDLGVGIFESLQLRNLRRRLLSTMRMLSNAKLLHDILQGKIESTTGQSYRGKGLPGMFRAARGGRIRRLVVVSNDAFADVDRGEYATIDPPFRGTIVAWEVGKEHIR